MSFKRKKDVTPSNSMNDVIFQWRQLSHTLDDVSQFVTLGYIGEMH